MFQKINILEALKKEEAELQSAYLLQDARNILSKEFELEKKIKDSLQKNNDEIVSVQIDNSDPDRIFSEQAIKNICIRYRLRFLNASLFKSDIPYDAITEIKRITKESETELSKFKIMAPKRLFTLRDADADPLLFVPTADGNYYLIHQWGTDLAWYNKILHFPSRSLGTLVVTILFFALLIAMLIPNNWLVPPSFMATNDIFGYWGFHRVAFFFHVTILICGITIFYWFAFHKNFSTAEWNKKTFN